MSYDFAEDDPACMGACPGEEAIRDLLRCAGTLPPSGDAEQSVPVPCRFRILPQNPESSGPTFRC
jgi:hypothetical protein